MPKLQTTFVELIKELGQPPAEVAELSHDLVADDRGRGRVLRAFGEFVDVFRQHQLGVVGEVTEPTPRRLRRWVGWVGRRLLSGAFLGHFSALLG